MTITGNPPATDAEFTARLDAINAADDAPESWAATVERTRFAAQVAVTQMPADWWCPRDDQRPRINCPECIAEVAVLAALRVVTEPADGGAK